MRRFAGLRLSDSIPDETTILNFRHFLEKHGLGKLFLKEINKHLQHQGLLFREGTLVDASIISAPSSTKNQSGERDPEMHSTKKGNQWYFGMKMHIGVDDITMAGSLLHGEKKRVFGYNKVRYKGFEKNHNRLCLLAGLTNLMIGRKYLLA